MSKLSSRWPYSLMLLTPFEMLLTWFWQAPCAQMDRALFLLLLAAFGACHPAVFVVVTISVPIIRQDFTDATQQRFQQALETVAEVNAGSLVIAVVAQSTSAAATTITSNIATSDPYAANSLVKSLNSSRVDSGMVFNGFSGCKLELVQVTACVPGFELLSSQTCGKCPADYFCEGGTIPRQSCPSGSYTQAGSNSSKSCIAVIFVVTTVTLPLTVENFTASEDKFKQAIAAVAGVNVNTVVIVSMIPGRRSASDSIQVVSQLACTTRIEASNVANHLQDKEALNAQLSSRGLPSATLMSVTVTDAAINTESGPSTSLIGGVATGGFVLLVLVSVGTRIFMQKLFYIKARQVLLKSLHEGNVGDKATSKHLPSELNRQYIAEAIVGKGAFGSVVMAKINQDNKKMRASLKSTKDNANAMQPDIQNVAIKIVFPSKGASFSEKEIHQLRREKAVLQLFSKEKCEHAVHLAAISATNIQQDICWFVMEMLQGKSLEQMIHEHSDISSMECFKAARSILAALKVMHTNGLVHRDIKPANIMIPREGIYKLIDFGTAVGIDDNIVNEEMMTVDSNQRMGAGTPPYMSPEMFTDPKSAKYTTDLWSLGVTMFEMVTGMLPFCAEDNNYVSWGLAMGKDMDKVAPSVLDKIGEDKRASFDNNLAKVIAKALQKRVNYRHQSADEMHEAVYSCLVLTGEEFYSVFISCRVISEAPLARLLFDELNHTTTPGGHRVTVYWDAHRLVNADSWEEGFATGLLNSLCIFPLLSYGATAPLAELSEGAVLKGWEETPARRPRLKGQLSDPEDNVLKEFLIACTLLERRGVEDKCDIEKGMLQLAFPILIGRSLPKGNLGYPGMGSFFEMEGGGGKYPKTPSPPTNRAVVAFLRDKAGLPEAALKSAEQKSVEAVLKHLTSLQGCKLWELPQQLPREIAELKLAKQQEELVGKGLTGPHLDLTADQRRSLGAGFDQEQLQALKRMIRHKIPEFHKVIDRAVMMKRTAGLPAPSEVGQWGSNTPPSVGQPASSGQRPLSIEEASQAQAVAATLVFKH